MCYQLELVGSDDRYQRSVGTASLAPDFRFSTAVVLETVDAQRH